MKKYVPREIEKVLIQASQQFPAVALTGVRQSGKTTLLRHLFGKSHQFVTFDDPLNIERALSDPRLFLDSFSSNVILDEIQYVPELLSFIKMAIDEKRDEYGRFLLTGSQQFHLMKNLGDSLAGRVALLNLSPFNIAEKKRAHIFTDSNAQTINYFVHSCLRGSFPEPCLFFEKNVELWYASYLQTYLERDVRNFANVGDLRNFNRFIKLLAARCGQILNLTTFANDLGISPNTVKRWISILEASQIIYLLQPYYRNLGKRIIKSPKLYFLDAGLVCYLTGIQTETQLLNGPLAGQLFENFIVQEIVKSFLNRGKQPNIYYLRAQNQLEIDIIVETNLNKISLIEIKLAKTLTTRMAKPMENFIKTFHELSIKSAAIISLNEESTQLTRHVRAQTLEMFLEELFDSISKDKK